LKKGGAENKLISDISIKINTILGA